MYLRLDNLELRVNTGDEPVPIYLHKHLCNVTVRANLPHEDLKSVTRLSSQCMDADSSEEVIWSLISLTTLVISFIWQQNVSIHDPG